MPSAAGAPQAGEPGGKPAPPSAPRSPGRRERNKQDKWKRILDAATVLFTERGYSAVTTQEIADAAGVGTGTLFRYTGSKAGLLMLVMNERIRRGAERGLELARAGAPPEESVLALAAPLAGASLGHLENTVVHHRETLFGSGPEQQAAAERVARLEEAIEEIIRLYAAGNPVRPDTDPALAAHALYSTMYLDIVRVGLGRAPAEELPERLRRSVRYLLGALLLPPPGGPAR
ncbi:TetR/AcrR family transcriptional regulator [Streptomyces sp. LP05-1]|uniref:TetR/AcrR family transcriptional regulator n=1 Tax=Streptomyces pyxinae TaxID=2970734 RepID=A0ABT2CH31_9ACTN|nr:TetR/AcrR family transcriptional regulator [Streptomyces sp. LP05-1]MCS0636718.1 TetR/AcrR family transcriptional regulator [Streptomyces sp. LP05-1]